MVIHCRCGRQERYDGRTTGRCPLEAIDAYLIGEVQHGLHARLGIPDSQAKRVCHDDERGQNESSRMVMNQVFKHDDSGCSQRLPGIRVEYFLLNCMNGVVSGFGVRQPLRPKAT
jgi:hypothetical protein